MKTCSICKQKKLYSDFPIREMKGDGFSAHCKSCAAAIHKNWKLRNLVHYNKSQLLYARRRKSTNILFKISCNLRGRLNKALRGFYKTGSAIRDLGCSVQVLRDYLESKFQPGMTWENYGLKGWHIDHIRPLSKFNLEDPEQVKLACHYTNLQPLWAADNLRKGARSMVK